MTSGTSDSAVSTTVVTTNVRWGRRARRESTTARIVPMIAPTNVICAKPSDRDRLAADLQRHVDGVGAGGERGGGDGGGDAGDGTGLPELPGRARLAGLRRRCGLVSAVAVMVAPFDPPARCRLSPMTTNAPRPRGHPAGSFSKNLGAGTFPPVFVSVFVRRLRPGKTYEDFLAAWYEFDFSTDATVASRRPASWISVSREPSRRASRTAAAPAARSSSTHQG